MLIKNWKLTKEEVKKWESEETELKPVLSADIVKQDGVEVELMLRSSSVRLISALRPCLDGQDRVEGVLIKIKKIGKKTNVNYDVELAEH